MSDNEEETETGTTQERLEPLMSESERKAVRTLTSETVPTPNVTIDSIFSILTNPGRRYILTYLLRSDGYVTMSDLIDYVVEQSDTPKADDEFRHQMTVEFTHTHLPKLVEEGFVKYNMERQLIDKTPKTQLVAPYLKLALLQQQRIEEYAPD